MTKPTFEGLTADELLALPAENFETLVFTRDAVVARIGTAEILCHFRKTDSGLTLELGHIDGGGEGVLPAIASVALRYAQSQNLGHVDWLVHAVDCPKPNPKLVPLLERRGFAIEDVPGVGRVYCKRIPITPRR